MSERIEIVVGAAGFKQRLDEFLFGRFGELSKMYLRELVKNEKCEVNGRAENVGHRLRENDFIEIELDLARQTSMRPEAMELDIVFEDDDLIVVNKAAGVLVHPTNYDRSGTLLNGMAFYLNRPIADRGLRIADSSSPDCGGIGDDFPGIELLLSTSDAEPVVEQKSAIRNPNSAIIRPGLIHRLDRQTSGLIVIAKNQRSHKRMTKNFQQRYVQKHYLAMVDGVVADDAGTISASIGRYGDLKHWDVKEGAKESETHFRVLRRDADRTLLELQPVTGRTNQLRIHCAHIGHPIVGDVDRGGSEHERLCLHAWKLSFRHPSTQQQVELTCEPADAFHHDAMLIRQSSATRS
jgi:23S rRNA pseudouridine1911/1915/1917 synthase